MAMCRILKPIMEHSRKEELFRKAFFATIMVNACIAVADIIVGFFFVFQEPINAFLFLSDNSFLNSIQPFVGIITNQNQLMGILYFFSHGIVKLTLVWGLLTNRLWAYPFAIALLGIFTLYQFYEIALRFSFFTAILIIVNGITIYFIGREYRQIVVQ